MRNKLFPTDLPETQWVEFDAEGFSVPVTGVIYDAENPPTNGLPLGGVDTGCLDLECTGLLGYMSIFNSLAPRRGPLNVPFLGLQVEGRTYVLAAHGMPGVEPARKIRYWGHYPVADVEFELDGPLSVGLRAWSPFIPGDVESSMIPGAVFAVHLRNESDRRQEGKLTMSFPGFDRSEVIYSPTLRQEVQGEFSGGIAGTTGGPFEANPKAWHVPEVNYALGVMGEVPFHLGYHLGWNATAWQGMGTSVPPMKQDNDNSGLSVTIDFEVEPHSQTVVRFVLAWYAPEWYGGGTWPAGGNAYRHMYATQFGSAEEVALHLTRNHEALLRRIVAWQEILYSEEALPGWLREALINNLHLITETGVWAQAQPPIGEWCRPEDGLFGLNECPRACPQIECLPCSLYGNLPVVYFFPKLALSTLRGYKAYQFEDGRPTWVFGGLTDRTGPYEMASPAPGYQTSLNGCCLVEMVDKMWLRSGDDDLLREFYDMCKRATIFTMNLRPEYGDRQVISMPTGNEGSEWFEAPEPGWCGMATHIGGVRLAHLLMMKRMAQAMGDTTFVQQCRHWFQAGAEALEEHLWVGEYYLNFYEPETGVKSDLVFGYQLDGQSIAKFHGTEDAFPPERMKTTLETIKRCNVPLSNTGVVNYANLDGTAAVVGGYGPYGYFPPELVMLAMTYIYQGEREFGLELVRCCWENITCRQRLTWDQPNLFRGDLDTGERNFGNDYYQNMMLWSLPAALENSDLRGPCEPGGLVARVIAAGQKE